MFVPVAVPVCDTVTRVAQRYSTDTVTVNRRKYYLAFVKSGYNVGLGINLSILG